MRRCSLVASAALVVLLFSTPCAAQHGWRDRLGSTARIASLRSSDRAQRIASAEWLGRWGEGDAAALALIDALAIETEGEVRAVIADALARLGDPRAVDVLIATVPSMRPPEHEARLRALAAIDSAPARRALAAELSGAGAALALPRIVEIGAPMVDELVPLLATPDAAIAATDALGRIGDLRCAEALEAHARASDPAMRVAVLGALGAIADERSAPIVLAALDDPDASVVVAALGALARLATLETSDVIASRLTSPEPSISLAALVALAVIDPARAAPALERALVGVAEPLAAEAARTVILAAPDPAFAPLLIMLAREGGAGHHALARVSAEHALEGGEGEDVGLSALVRLAAEGSGDARLAIAIALRHGASRSGAEAALRSEPDATRRAVLLAIARDPAVHRDLVRTLAGGPSEARAIAAHALELAGGTGARAELASAIELERDPVALEAMARALAAARGEIDAEIPIGLAATELAPARLLLASIARAPASPERARDLDRILHDALVARDPRVRAMAALALARAPGAAFAVAGALEDPIAEVRLAAIRALSTSGALQRSSVARRAASRLAVERDPRARRALRDALTDRDARPPAQGTECLVAQLDRHGAEAGVVVEVVLDDGRWLRERALATGELVICDLPAGEADLRLPP